MNEEITIWWCIFALPSFLLKRFLMCNSWGFPTMPRHQNPHTCFQCNVFSLLSHFRKSKKPFCNPYFLRLPAIIFFFNNNKNTTVLMRFNIAFTAIWTKTNDFIYFFIKHMYQQQLQSTGETKTLDEEEKNNKNQHKKCAKMLKFKIHYYHLYHRIV